MKPCITYKQQRGHAAILFALMIPLLFGVFILGTDGARALQDKARLEEASEVAALAIAGQSGGSEKSGDKLASDYIQYYFPQADVKKIETQVIPCENNDFCKQDGAASERFFEYQVAAHIEEPNWFSKSSIETSFGDNLNIGGYSSARKYQSKTVDVVLVADFSWSMHFDIHGNDKSPRKYIDLQKVISNVADTLKEYNDRLLDKKQENKIAFIGFNRFVPGGKKYDSINVRDQYTYMFCTGKRDGHSNNDGWCFNDDTSIDYDRTVNNIFNPEKFSPVYTEKEVTFYPINLTSNFADFKKQVNQFYPSGTTAFYGGLIKGAQVADQGKNPRRLIVILSDGMNSNEKVTKKMIDHDLCKAITDKFNKEETSSGEQVKSRLFAIGFGYPITEYPEMAQCVGESNVYDAQDSQAIKNKILELIAEEMGRLTPSDEK